MRIWKWIKRNFMVSDTDTIRGKILTTVNAGDTEFEIDMMFVEGTTAQELIAGALAASALNTIVGDIYEPLAKATVEHHAYKVRVRCHVEFEPTSETYRGPIFEGASLVEHIRFVREHTNQ